jgi:hypothetical protein
MNAAKEREQSTKGNALAGILDETETPVDEPAVGGDPVADGGTRVPREAEPGPAPENATTAAAAPFPAPRRAIHRPIGIAPVPAVRCPLPGIVDHVAQAEGVRGGVNEPTGAIPSPGSRNQCSARDSR